MVSGVRVELWPLGWNKASECMAFPKLHRKFGSPACSTSCQQYPSSLGNPRVPVSQRGNLYPFIAYHFYPAFLECGEGTSEEALRAGEVWRASPACRTSSGCIRHTHLPSLCLQDLWVWFSAIQFAPITSSNDLFFLIWAFLNFLSCFLSAALWGSLGEVVQPRCEITCPEPDCPGQNAAGVPFWLCHPRQGAGQRANIFLCRMHSR